MTEPDGRLVLACPACGRQHDCQMMVNRPGDVSVCIDCGAFSILDPTMELRRLTGADRLERAVGNPTQWELAEQASRLARARGGV